MRRKLPDVSTTQLIASGVATLVAAVGASYLGVYGTIIGAGLMSVMSTAGSAVVKHYLDQGRSQIKDLTHLQAAVNRRGTVEHAAAEAKSADPTRTVMWPAGDPNATRLDPNATSLDPNATRVDLNLPGGVPGGGDPNATRLDRTPAETVADALATAAGADAVREVVRRSALDATTDWVKQHWMKLVVSSAAIFAIVIGGITVYEAATGSPIGNGKGGGTTLSKALTGGGGGGGGGTDESPKSPVPSTRATTSGDAPADGPSGGVASTGTPTTAPPTTTRPTEPTAPTSTAATTPSAPNTPDPTKSPEGGTGGDGQQQDGNGAEPQITQGR
ncbi:hypothetical protein [Actinomadura verrucosospora]|uniref:Uncharacterized protein n=1 Tax=Actinomadura verrucosospora TaxID=46165 RepID=A0A7D4AL12_ACTVE|nr:hypothetical protein [Actinomadura verrucosospora]QKG21008.1 Hypothetical protein ACTIVE_2646 [Actinomadura verrucosospora]